MSKRYLEVSFEVKGHASVTIEVDKNCTLTSEEIFQKLKDGVMTLSIVKGEELNDLEGKFYGRTELVNPEGLEYFSYMVEGEINT